MSERQLLLLLERSERHYRDVRMVLLAAHYCLVTITNDVGNDEMRLKCISTR